MEYIDSRNLDAQVDIMSRRLLVLAWMMPPLLFPRALQISRILRAMSERDWRTTVIAVPPDIEPWATKDPDLETFYFGSYEIHYVEPREEIESSPLWLRIVRGIMRIKETRDSNWIRRASSVLCEQITAKNPEALISFAQPWINHQVALRVKSRHPQLPWIAHFSDPWVDSIYFSSPDEKTLALAIKEERAIISQADAVIFTTQETANLVMAKYPKFWARKIHILQHSYDMDLLRLIKPRPKLEKFTIIHTGNLYEKREPFAFLRALEILRNEITEAQLQVKFIGYATKTMQDFVQQMGLSKFVFFIPTMSYLDSLAIAQSADLLLLIDAPSEQSVFLPSKIADYLFLQRPILVMTPQSGASARILGSHGFPIVDPTDEATILSMLREFIKRWQRGESISLLPPPEMLRMFDSREVATEFEDVLNSVILSGKYRYV
jgi:glycosyltransferase involved in cell wall biosynthesis